MATSYSAPLMLKSMLKRIFSTGFWLAHGLLLTNQKLRWKFSVIEHGFLHEAFLVIQVFGGKNCHTKNSIVTCVMIIPFITMYHNDSYREHSSKGGKTPGAPFSNVDSLQSQYGEVITYPAKCGMKLPIPTYQFPNFNSASLRMGK